MHGSCASRRTFRPPAACRWRGQKPGADGLGGPMNIPRSHSTYCIWPPFWRYRCHCHGETLLSGRRAHEVPADRSGRRPRGRPRHGQEAGSGLQLQIVRDHGSRPRSRRARLRRDPDDRPDASLSKGRVMEWSARRMVMLEVRGRCGAYGPIYVRRWPAPITNCARNVTHAARELPTAWRRRVRRPAAAGWPARAVRRPTTGRWRAGHT